VHTKVPLVAWFVTPRVRFLHVPKTGGSWAPEAIRAAGVPVTRPEGPPGHATLAESWDYADRFTFAIVRHPLDYWRSYWAFRVRTGWEMNHPLDRDFGTDNFEEFIEAVIAHDPGYASDLFEWFVGPPDGEIDFIGRYENLVDDVCLALALGGESFDEELLRSYPKVNVSQYGAHGPRYPPSLAARLAEVERRGIERFYSEDPLPARLIIGGERPRPSQQVADLTVQLRTARAQLEQTRRSLQHTQVAYTEAQRSLAVVQGSHLQRRTRRLRSVWYQYRGLRASIRGSGARALARPGALGGSKP
jgi:hypothetical protein